MSGVEGTGQVAEGNSMSTELTLGIGVGLLMVDNCGVAVAQHTGREALSEGCDDLGRFMGLGCDWGMQGRLGKVLFELMN